jgi:hypothetical protein
VDRASSAGGRDVRRARRSGGPVADTPPGACASSAP